jgi:hypothetical protein
MLSSRTCPDEVELLAVAAGEEPSGSLRNHVAACPHCPGHLVRLRNELAVLRENAPEALLSPSTASGPGPKAAKANG